ncbi:alpha/beta-hydrolase [Thozetella sp. PMI_491]|nr:alpha/beta-hydrolase [Thozetella sp. PMI_491]
MNYFLSIPYAVPPLGDLRFTPPQPYDTTYDGIRDATRPPPSCPQFGPIFVAYQAGQSEDCLFIDIWAPRSTKSSSKLPVKVWLYGGGNQAGGISFPPYDGCASDTTAVHVSINYRVGPLGFLVLESAGIKGNYGLQDQILALQWVQENIAAFGGDKTKVVVYGQSAGGLDAHTLASLDIGPSLMRSAIMESGAGQALNNWTEANSFGAKFASALPCNLTDVACLRAATPEHMNTTILNMFAGGSNTYIFVGQAGWGPVIDEALVPAHPTEAGIKVPSLIGSTTQEATLFVYVIYGNGSSGLNQTDYDAALIGNFGPLAATVNASYPLSAYDDTSMPAFYALAALNSLFSIHCAAYRALLSPANRAPVYAYSFDHTPSCAWLPWIAQEAVPQIGPAHTAEIPFVFGNVRNLPFGDGDCDLTESEGALSKYIQAAWTKMAGTGKPGANWPEFTGGETEGVIFNETPIFGTVDYSMCKFWDEIAARLEK